MALVMTLTTVAPNKITIQGNGPCGTGAGAQGANANAVSIVSMSRHVVLALAGMTEGAQYNIEATVSVLTILRKFMVAPV